MNKTQTMPDAGGAPILGAALPLLKDPLGYLRRKHSELGPVFSVRAPMRQFVVLAGAEANRFVAVEGRNSFTSQPFWGELAKSWDSEHFMLAMDGPDHMWLRRAYRNDLLKGVVDKHRVALESVIDRAVHSEGDGAFSVQDFTRSLVSRLVHLLLTDGGAPIDERTITSLLEVFRWETNALLLGKWPRLMLRAPQYRRHRRRAERFLQQLGERIAEAPPESGWMRTTVESREERPDLFRRGDYHLTLLLPFIGGVDTVGATLGFLLYEFTRRDDIREAVTNAVDKLYEESGGEVPTIDALRGDETLHGVVLETLRLYPAAFAMYRQTSEDVQFARASISKGTDIVVLTSASHTDEQYFAKPFEFDIERFAEPRREHKQAFAFAPYGGGPHVCLGAGMGEALLLVLTAVLVRNYDMSAFGVEQPMRPTYDPSLVVSPRLRICAKRRV